MAVGALIGDGVRLKVRAGRKSASPCPLRSRSLTPATLRLLFNSIAAGVSLRLARVRGEARLAAAAMRLPVGSVGSTDVSILLERCK